MNDSLDSLVNLLHNICSNDDANEWYEICKACKKLSDYCE